VPGIPPSGFLPFFFGLCILVFFEHIWVSCYLYVSFIDHFPGVSFLYFVFVFRGSFRWSSSLPIVFWGPRALRIVDFLSVLSVVVIWLLVSTHLLFEVV